MKLYLIDDESVEVNEFDERLETAIESDCEDNYDYMLDDVCDEVKIGSLSYSPSQVLLAVDPIAYRCGLSDYVSSVLDDARYMLDRGESVYYDGLKFEVTDSDDDDEGCE